MDETARGVCRRLGIEDPKHVEIESKRRVRARKAVYEYDEHNNARRALSIGGNIAVPFVGTAASLA